MEFQLSNTDLCAILERPFFIKRAEYVIRFCDQYRLWPKSKKLTVSLSGGADSLFLLLVMKHALKKSRFSKFSAVHFHHGNRGGQDAEERFVRKVCDDLGVDLFVKRLGLKEVANFEHRAREARYAFLKSHTGEFDAIALGQHLDDSFEWSLMQQFKSSSLTPILGIPLVNENVIRPLMCFSALQIRHGLDHLKVPYLKDPTNEDRKFERNYIRHQLIPKIKERYPAYLQHYVARSNNLAFALGKHRKKQNQQQWRRFEDHLGGIGIYCQDLEAPFVGGAEWLIDLIKELSQAERGSLREQVSKMIEAQQKGKKGPMKFSGGVYGFMDKGLFYFIHADGLPRIHRLDKDMSLSLNDAQILKVGQIVSKENWISQSIFPFLIYSDDKNSTKYFGPGMKKSHFLFPKTTKVLLDRGVYFQTFTRALSYRKGRPLKDNVSFYFLQTFDQH